MSLDKCTLDIPVTQCVEISKNGKIEFEGTIRELQEYYYTLCQYEIIAMPYKIVNKLCIQIK